ncbi:MAG: hypothetical protein HY332_14855 [Chloroflexi bacterium]|nr:hypothetical protein [Chloroflexota bacterium]
MSGAVSPAAIVTNFWLGDVFVAIMFSLICGRSDLMAASCFSMRAYAGCVDV